MKITRREIALALVVAAVLLLGLGYLVGASIANDWGSTVRLRAQLTDRKKQAEDLIKGRADVVQQLDNLQKALPRFRLDQQVLAELLKSIQKIADENQLSLKRLIPDKEKEVGDLSELAIECHWEGSLEQLVRFLYAVQVQGAMLDIRELKVDPAQGVAGLLRGTFTVFCAFKRESEETPSAAPAPPAATTPGASG